MEDLGRCEASDRAVGGFSEALRGKESPASGTRETLSDDIKSASLELLVPTDLEKHLILNKNRLTSYELMKQEIELVVESSVGSKGAIARPGPASSSSGPQPMDVDAVTQWISSLR